MKKFAKKFLLVVALVAAAASAQAQQPYKHSIGVSVGSLEGVSYKMFFTDQLALHADLGFQMLATRWGNKYFSNAEMSAWTFVANPNIVYQDNITGWNWGGIGWFAGGGLSLGLAQFFGDENVETFGGDIGYDNTWGKWGINAIAGVELGLDDAPLAISLDFRPGYGMAFVENGTVSFFDWTIAASVRYTF
jgi:hypothetical protein